MRIVLLLALSGCVLQPTDGEPAESRLDPIGLDGYAASPEAELEIRAFNHDTGMLEPVRTFEATATPGGIDPVMYWYQTDGLQLGERYWRPSSSPCTASGQARLEVWQRNGTSYYRFGTFDEAGYDCLMDQVLAGTDYYEAGTTCSTGHEVRIPVGGQCPLSWFGDMTPPTLVLRVPVEQQDGVGLPSEPHVLEAFDEPPGGVTEFYRFSASRRYLRFRADTTDDRGVASSSISGVVRLFCPGGHVERPFSTTVNAVPGAVDVSIGSSINVDLWPYYTACAGAAPFYGIVEFQATGRNSAGLVATTDTPFVTVY